MKQQKTFYLISFDVDYEKRDYGRFCSEIEEFGSAKQVYYDCWILCTEETITAKNVLDHLRKYIANGDTIFIAEINTENCTGRIGLSIWGWINRIKGKEVYSLVN